MQKIYLGGGCFWGLQAYFDLLEGVVSTRVGYANSVTNNPSYKEVCSGRTGAVEALELVYDETILELDSSRAGRFSKDGVPDCLLGRFFSVIDASALNFQGNDRGTQYRSGIYALEEGTIECAREFVHRYIAPQYAPKAVVTEIAKLENFYAAEEYHQKYLEKNPHGYCHIDINMATKPL